MALRLLGSDAIHLNKGTYMWVQLTHFAFDLVGEDHSILEALVASPGYAHDYASPFDADAGITEPAVHGRWWRDRIRADLFERWSPDDAVDLIDAWANTQEGTEPGYGQPSDVQDRLQGMYELLRAGQLYKLTNPGTDAEHDYGFVTGDKGFHEFVVIDHSSRSLHVVVASDD